MSSLKTAAGSRTRLVLLSLSLLLSACGVNRPAGTTGARPAAEAAPEQSITAAPQPGTPASAPQVDAAPALQPGPARQLARPASQAASATPVPTAPPAPSPTAAPSPTPTPDPAARFMPAMRRGFEGDISAQGDLPHYELQLTIDPRKRVLRGSEQIHFVNRTGVPLTQIALRLYPNFPPDAFGNGGDVRMDITEAAINGQPVAARYTAQRTAVLLPLPAQLEPGQRSLIRVSFSATIKAEVDGSWPLTAYYPLLAVHDADGWRLDVTRFADKVYAESALYSAEITIPSRLRLVSVGSTIATKDQGNGTTTYSIRSGPVRDFAMSLGDFVAVQQAAGDVSVNVYTVRGSRLDAAQVAQITAASLATFDRRFGRYPYAELDVHLLPGDFDGGDEHPGLIFVYSDRQVDAGTRFVTAHEVAHQWWYAVAGNDIYRQPWLDESFAQYSAIIYAEDVAGAAVAQADWEREVLRRYRGAVKDGDLPVGLPITAYPSFNVYYRTVYGKGAVLLRKLREELGDEAFFGGLQAYYQQHRYGVGSTAAIRQSWERASGRSLEAIFRAWVTGR